MGAVVLLALGSPLVLGSSVVTPQAAAAAFNELFRFGGKCPHISFLGAGIMNVHYHPGFIEQFEKVQDKFEKFTVTGNKVTLINLPKEIRGILKSNNDVKFDRYNDENDASPEEMCKVFTDYLKSLGKTERIKQKFNTLPPLSSTPNENTDENAVFVRRRLATAKLTPSEEALCRRRLMNRPKSHVVVLDPLLAEINGLQTDERRTHSDRRRLLTCPCGNAKGHLCNEECPEEDGHFGCSFCQKLVAKNGQSMLSCRECNWAACPQCIQKDEVGGGRSPPPSSTSDEPFFRRRLMNRPKSPVVVLEALLQEINQVS